MNFGHAATLGQAIALCLGLGLTLSPPARADALKSRQVIDLWPGVPPGTEASTATPTIVERSKSLFNPDRALTGIVKPSLTAFVPDKPNGVSIIVAPGGAYARIVLDKEGREIVNWLQPLGVTVFVMTYRLPAEGHLNGRDVPLEDGQRAMRVVRDHAKAWGLDPTRIGFMGFSAAGHLGASLVAEYDQPVYKPVDEADTQSARPDFAVLMYPVVTMDADFANMETRTNLLGKDPTPEAVEQYSPDKHVGKDAPEVFMALADNDSAVPTENAIRFYQGLKRVKVAAELHIYREGDHGFGIERAAGLPAGEWPAQCEKWLRRIGILK
jgi:acetyl esterase/lipase